MNKKHTWIMIACCLVPIAILALVALFNIPLSSVIYIVLILLCPVSHILMMKYMGQGEGHQHGETLDHAHHDATAQISKPDKISD